MLPAFAAVILAAGKGSRMGRPKALLRVGENGAPLVLEHARRFLSAGAREVVVVVRPELEVEVRGLLEGLPVTVVSAVTEGPYQTLQVALARTADLPLLVTPVDMLPVRPETLSSLVRALTPELSAVTPRFAAKGGHPVFLRRAALTAKAETLHDALEALGPLRVRLDVLDPRVLGDLDTPADLLAQAATP